MKLKLKLAIIRLVRWVLRNLWHPLFEWHYVRQIRNFVLMDPLKGDYCLPLQKPVRRFEKPPTRNQYCLEATIIGHVCQTQCKWGLRTASNRQRARAIQEAKKQEI